MLNIHSIKYLKVLIPPAVGALYIFILYALKFEQLSLLASLLSAYIFPPFGKESIIPVGISLHIDPFLISFSIILIDFLAALFIYWNYELVKRIRYIGRAMDRVEAKSNQTIKKRWFGKLWWVGLTLFMIVPFQGTGSVTTTVIGRILGVGRNVLIVVLIGSTISSMLIAFVSSTIFTGFFGI